MDVSIVKNSLYIVGLRISDICTASDFRNKQIHKDNHKIASNMVQEGPANHDSGHKSSLLGFCLFLFCYSKSQII